MKQSKTYIKNCTLDFLLIENAAKIDMLLKVSTYKVVNCKFQMSYYEKQSYYDGLKF